MTRAVSYFHTRCTLIAMSACAVCLGVQAQSAIVDASVSAGVGVVGHPQADRALFGQYNGLRSRDAVGLLSLDYSLRDQENGKWIDLTGSDILGDTRELNFVWKNPGFWKVTANYGELVRVDPNTLNTTLTGAGSATPQVQQTNQQGFLAPVGSGVDTDLKTKRTSVGLGLTKIITPSLKVQVDLKSENKEGVRAFGLGSICSSQLEFQLQDKGTNPAIISACTSTLMLPEPVNSNHSQIEARVSYALERLRFSVGYYGSYFSNSSTLLDTSGLSKGVKPNLPSVALSPDNQAHQLDLSGSYDLTGTTRGTFKLAWASASQNADFSNAGLIGPVVAANNPAVTYNSPDAKVITTLAKLGITSRPLPQLSLLGDLRYEDKDDQTPLFNYDLLGTNLLAKTQYATNHSLPNRKIQGKLQASWQFNHDYRGTLGLDQESIDRGTVTASSRVSGISALRQKTDETGVRAELRSQLADDLSGTVSVSSSQRNGSSWLQPNSGLGTDPKLSTYRRYLTGVTEGANPALGAVFSPTLADRQRDKLKLFADWQASEKLSLQFSAENGTDKFSAPNANGLRDTRMGQIGLDWSFALTDNWAVNGYLSQSTQTLNQAFYRGTVMAFDNTNLGASIGVSGKASSKVHLGASLSYMDDRSAYAQSPDASAPADVASTLAKTGGLPDINYSQTTLKLFADYALEKKSSVRIDLIHQRASVNDWAPLVYSDNSTVTQNQDQNVSYVGVTYIYQLP